MTDAEKAELDVIRYRFSRRLLWMILQSNGGYTLEKEDMEDFPGDDRAIINRVEDPVTMAVTLTASRT